MRSFGVITDNMTARMSNDQRFRRDSGGPDEADQRPAGLNGAAALFAPLSDPTLWPRKVSNAPKAKPEAVTTLRPNAHQKHPQCYRTQSGGDLGPYIRWLVALRLLLRLCDREHQHWPWHEFCQHHENTAHKTLVARILREARHGEDLEQLEADFYAAFRPDRSGWKAPGRYLVGRVFECMLAALSGALGRTQPLPWHRFFEVRNLVPDESITVQTLYRFEQWLRHEIHPPSDSLGHLECEYLLLGRPRGSMGRRQQLRDVCEKLTSSDPSRSVVNVFTAANRTGLRAFATSVLCRLHRLRGLRLKHHRDAPGLIYVPLFEKSNGLKRVTREEVSAHLRKCFGLPVKDPDPLRGSPNLAWEVAELRRALSTYPTVVVFDTIEVNEGPQGAIHDYIQDSQWEDYIRALVQPAYDVLRQSGLAYPSRFLVLSNRELSGLFPWASMQEKLESAEYGAGRTLLESPDVLQPALKRQSRRMGAKLSENAMHQVYTREQAKLDLVFKTPALGGDPTEADLTMASLLSEGDLRDVLVGSMSQGAARAEVRTRLVHRWIERHARSDDAASALVLVLMIAASIDGLRLPTLARTVRRWLKVTRIKSDLAQGLEKLTRDVVSSPDFHCPLMDRFPSLLVYRIDPDTPGVGEDQRRFELVDTEASQDPIDAADRRLLDLRLHDMRQMLQEVISASDREPHDGWLGSVEPTWLGMTRSALWSSINFVLGEEALRQATSQARNLDSRDLISPYVHRRMVHAIYHGLVNQSHEERRPAERADAPEGEPSWGVQSATKRYRLLYVFLYRNCIERAPDWMLGRSFARSELRFELLQIFIAPTLVRPLGAMEPGSEQELERLRTQLAVRRDINERDVPVYLDILEAIGRAAYDSGRHGIARLVAGEAERLMAAVWRAGPPPNGAAQRTGSDGGTLATLRDEIDVVEVLLKRMRASAEAADTGQTRPLVLSFARGLDALAFLKLRIDSLQAQRELDEAKRLCLDWLRAHVKAPADLLRFGERFDAPSKVEQASDSGHKATFERMLEGHVHTLLGACADSRAAEALADLLSRVGEILATEADSQSDWRLAGTEFMNAYAVYWIADRIRSGAGGYTGNTRWPTMSARPVRYYVRVSLKVARVIAQGALPQTPAWHCALHFFSHARDRLDAYTRHLFHWPRERLAMLLLMAASSRVWHEITGAPQKGGGTNPQDADGLQASLGYIAHAESLAIELGLQKVLCYRVLFERVKTGRRLLELDSMANAPLRLLIERDLDVLSRMAKGNPFWSELVRRQQNAMQEAGQA
jgi:hypothetical protein